MPPAGRLADPSYVPSDKHGCPSCPHAAAGPAIIGSFNVFINHMPALRVGDAGIHAACCGPNVWVATQGSPNVFINGRAAHRMGDATRHCGGTGKLVLGSPNVIINPGSFLSTLANLAISEVSSRIKINLGPFKSLNDVIKAVRNPVGFLSDQLKHLVGLGLDKLGHMIFGDVFDQLKAIAAKLWKLLEKIPVVGDYIKMIESFADNFFDSLALTILGQMHAYDWAPKGNIDCPGQLPTTSAEVLLSAPGARGLVDYAQGADLTWPLYAVLEEFAPVVYTFRDDAPALAIGDLLANGEWTSDDKYLDIDNDFARDRGAQVARGPYLSAWKISAHLVEMQVRFLRAVSYWPHPDPGTPLDFEHEGDGESAFLYIQFDETRRDGERVLGRGRIIAVKTSGHDKDRAYRWDQLFFEEDKRRLRLCIARGSHPVNVASGVRATKPGTFGINSEVFAGPDQPDCERSTDYQIAGAEEAAELHRNWDNNNDKGGRWGKERLFKTKNYPVWDPHASWGKKTPRRLLPSTRSPKTCPKGKRCPLSKEDCQSLTAAAGEVLPCKDKFDDDCDRLQRRSDFNALTAPETIKWL